MRTILCLSFIACVLSAAELRVNRGILPNGMIDDRRLLGELNLHAKQLRDAKDSVKAADLLKQLNRKQCQLTLQMSGDKKLNTAEIAERSRKGVLVVSGLYKCQNCPNWHSGAASGFMLTEDGAFCTSYHVVDNAKNDTLVIMTGDGRVAPVVEVLAADKRTDLAILRANGKGFTPLPVTLNPLDAPIGGKVRVFSHPNRHFYVLSEGIISRKYLDSTRKEGSRRMISITADFAKGSSGAPVFNEYGAVIASVNNTQSTYYDVKKDGTKDNLQMVFKNTVSLEHLRTLIKAK
jgi:S1-C subfamily serine protease